MSRQQAPREQDAAGSSRRRWFRLSMLLATALVFITLTVAGIFIWQIRLDGSQSSSALQSASSLATMTTVERSALLARGELLVRAGNCMGCHTQRGGADFAGGRTIATRFGEFVTPNITADVATGMGAWSADEFWRAMHHGRGRDGRLLYPSFPYTNYTRVSRQDSDAMYAWLRTVTPVTQVNEPHALDFPYNQRFLLAFWRALYFRPALCRNDDRQSVEWNRGAYLVQGLGHCSACHAERNALGATVDEASLKGALLPVQNWYAPPIHGGSNGAGEWSQAELAELLKTGVAPRGAVSGPMAQVVRQSLQFLPEHDVRAMAVYLKSLPAANSPDLPTARAAGPGFQATMTLGASLYEKQCASCHKSSGVGEPRVYPPLAGNSSVTAKLSVNTIRMVLNGGYAPGTAGNPRPHGMPPFGPFMSDEEVAAVVTYVRNAWGNRVAGTESEITAAQVNRYRSVPFE